MDYRISRLIIRIIESFVKTQKSRSELRLTRFQVTELKMAQGFFIIIFKCLLERRFSKLVAIANL